MLSSVLLDLRLDADASSLIARSSLSDRFALQILTSFDVASRKSFVLWIFVLAFCSDVLFVLWNLSAGRSGVGRRAGSEVHFITTSDQT